MNIQVLIENNAREGLVSEHGLSLFIEFEGKKYLLDAGTSGRFLENTEKMNVPITEAECCILSHGHYDHAGGFASYLAKNKIPLVYAMKSAVNSYYSASGGTIHEIGIPDNVYPVFADRFRLIEEVTKLQEKVYLIPHQTEKLEKIGERAKLYRKINEKYIPDDFSHELSLVFDTEKGMVIFNSCSHAGIENIITEVKSIFPHKNVYAFLGGLHMKGTKDGQEICIFSEKEIQDIVQYLEEIGLQKLYTGHCTGNIGFEMLRKYMGEKVEDLTTGKHIHI